MIDRTNQDVTRARFAELTGLVPQLTTPSRHHGELVDIWFGVRWSEHGPEWDESFERLSNGRRPDPGSPSYFGLFTHGLSTGLIVARQVTPDRSVWQAVEETAQALVEQVNRDVATKLSPPTSGPTSSSESRRGWSLRVRDASAFLFSLGWLGDQKAALPRVAEVPIRVSHRSTGRSR